MENALTKCDFRRTQEADPMTSGNLYLVNGRERMTDLKNSEKRDSPRFEMRLPLTVRMNDTQIQAFTSDVSNRGVFFYFQGEQQFTSALEFDITFPPEITLSTSLRVRCKGNVVRVAAKNRLGVGIAVKIHSYTFLNASEA
jgi:hypothetical protein